MTFRAVFLGPPGAGKGTQAQRVAAPLGALHVSTGDMLREQVRESTSLGRRAKAFMDAGELVTDELIIAMVDERLARPDAAGPFILDGFPRTLAQAEALDASLGRASLEPAHLEHSDRTLTHVVYFAVPHAALMRRLTGRRTCSKCGAIWNVHFRPTRVAGKCDECGGALNQREDDRETAVGQRLEVYNSLTEPLLGYYRSTGILVEIDADRSPEVVQEDLMTVLQTEVA